MSIRSCSISTPDKLHNVFSIRRSGHHAVISWLQDCYAETGVIACHVNEDETIGHIADPTDANWKVFTAEEIVGRAKSENDQCQTVLVNYEDLMFGDRLSIPAYADKYWERNSVSGLNTLVIRDWYNLAASRIMKNSKDRAAGIEPFLETVSWDQLSAIWVEHAELTLSDDRSDLTCIKFNDWRKDQHYRSSIATSLGLISSNTERLNNIPIFGGGSSFSGVDYDGAADQMNLDNRWEQLNDELFNEYTRVINSYSKKRIGELNLRLFGFDHASIIKA